MLRLLERQVQELREMVAGEEERARRLEEQGLQLQEDSRAKSS